MRTTAIRSRRGEQGGADDERPQRSAGEYFCPTCVRGGGCGGGHRGFVSHVLGATGFCARARSRWCERHWAPVPCERLQWLRGGNAAPVCSVVATRVERPRFRDGLWCRYYCEAFEKTKRAGRRGESGEGWGNVTHKNQLSKGPLCFRNTELHCAACRRTPQRCQVNTSNNAASNQDFYRNRFRFFEGEEPGAWKFVSAS